MNKNIALNMSDIIADPNQHILDESVRQLLADNYGLLETEIRECHAEIAELLDWSHKALKHLPQAYWDSLKEITEKYKVK